MVTYEIAMLTASLLTTSQNGGQGLPLCDQRVRLIAGPDLVRIIVVMVLTDYVSKEGVSS